MGEFHKLETTAIRAELCQNTLQENWRAWWMQFLSRFRGLNIAENIFAKWKVAEEIYDRWVVSKFSFPGYRHFNFRSLSWKILCRYFSVISTWRRIITTGLYQSTKIFIHSWSVVWIHFKIFHSETLEVNSKNKWRNFFVHSKFEYEIMWGLWKFADGMKSFFVNIFNWDFSDNIVNIWK